MFPVTGSLSDSPGPHCIQGGRCKTAPVWYRVECDHGRRLTCSCGTRRGSKSTRRYGRCPTRRPTCLSSASASSTARHSSTSNSNGNPSFARSRPSTTHLARNFYRAMHIVQSAVLRSHVVCLSICYVGESGPHRLKILETNCANN